MTVVDVGANIGTCSLLFSRLVGPTGRVYAFEPGPDNVSLLRRMAGKRANVVVVEGGAGEHDGEGALFLSKEMSVDHRTYDTGEGRRKIRVPMISLDSYFGDAKIDFVKLDIQGYELHALRGMKGILAGNKAIRLVLEFWSHGLRQAGTDPLELLTFLRGLEFAVTTLDGADVEPENLLCFRDEPSLYVNLFAERRA